MLYKPISILKNLIYQNYIILFITIIENIIMN